MPPDISIVLILVGAVVALTILARRLRIAYPILLVLGGLVLGFVPGLPRVALRPDLVFLLFLPPLLFYEALTASYREYRANLRPIALLSVGLVLATVVVVATVAHAILPGFSWASAFVLGAILGPTDEVAATAIADWLPLPRRIVTVLEAESLLNDATSLVVYNVAVAAVVSGSFSPPLAAVRFVLAAVGGVAIGLAAGWVVAQVRRRLYDPPVENTISLLTGFVAYLPAELLQLSGVLAVVAQGMYLGRQGPHIVSARTRLQNREMWAVAVFLLNGLLFVLVGLQLHPILQSLAARPPLSLVADALLVSATVVVVRIVWVFPATYLPRALFPRVRERDPFPPPQVPWIISWTGMRGGVSLAAALALPLAVHSGGPFPQRNLIVFLTFCVILATLVLQGLTLPVMIRRLDLHDDRREEREEARARLAAVRAGLERLESLDGSVPADMANDLRSYLEEKLRLYAALQRQPRDEALSRHREEYRRLHREVLAAERRAVVDLRDRGAIDDEVMRRVQYNIDLEEVRLEA